MDSCGQDLARKIISTRFVFFLFYRRKSMTGNWKTNQGSAMLEQMPITEKYKNWIDEVSAALSLDLIVIATALYSEQMQFVA